MRTLLFPAALAVTLALPAQQTTVKPFQPSPAGSVSQDLGICNVKVEFSSPGVKGRTIWGGLVPYGEVWRAGANNATVITFSDAVKIAGKDLPAGSYAFFAIPGPKTWTLILSRNAKQWGAYSHKTEEEALRWEATPTALAVPQEYLRYGIEVAGPDTLKVELAWEKLGVAFDATFDTMGVYWAYLEKTLAGAGPQEFAPFLRGAQYCLGSGMHLDKGMEWIDRSLKAKETYANTEVKAKLLRKAGRTAEALPLLARAQELAVAAKAPKEYLDGLEKTKAEWSAK
jgi:hypothetical protein